MKLTVCHKITDKDREALLDGLRAYNRQFFSNSHWHEVGMGMKRGYALKMSLPVFPERGMQRHYLTKEDLAD